MALKEVELKLGNVKIRLCDVQNWILGKTMLEKSRFWKQPETRNEHGKQVI